MNRVKSWTICICLLAVVRIAGAQGPLYINNPSAQSYDEAWLKWYYEEWWPKYEEALKKAWRGYCQAWNEEMGKGIKRLNNEPQQVGVTPINGALLLSTTDLSVPGRTGQFSISRFYNSKIWSGEVSNDTVNSYLKWSDLGCYMGLGWVLHFGRIWMLNDSGWIFENASGLQTYFKKKTGSQYLSTDGAFLLLQTFTDSAYIKTSDGSCLRFAYKYDDAVDQINYFYLTKIIDNKGNITKLFYNIVSSYLQIDSLRTSMSRKVTFYYGMGTGYHTLDSIKYSCFDNDIETVRYRYDYAEIPYSPFTGPFSYASAFLLKAIKFPNGDSVYYDYNSYGELVSAHTTGGALVKYELKTDSFYVPKRTIYPPGDTTKPLLRLTRGVIKTKAYDPWTAPDTSITQYKRVFRTLPIIQIMSNADSVSIIYPNGAYNVMLYMASGQEPRADNCQWNWDNGRLRQKRFHSSNGTQLDSTGSMTILSSGDSLPLISYKESTNGLKYYKVKYYNYDDYGNPRLVHDYGDVSVTTDDRWIHRRFAHGDSNYTDSLKITAWLDEPPITSTSKYFSTGGIDTLVIKRQWGYKSGSNYIWHHESTSTYAYNTAYAGNQTVTLAYAGDSLDTLVKVTSTMRKYMSPDSCVAFSIYDIHNLKVVDSDSSVKRQNDYLTKRIVHLVTNEKICADSAGSTKLTEIKYYYDDTCNIVKHYPYPDEPLQWEQPSLLRGNLTKIEAWKGSSDYTKAEFRYDDVSNAVYAITHPTSNTAETTFTYYDSTSSPDKYHYALPWRTVHHVSNPVCSLQTRVVYDTATALVVKMFNANGDSTSYHYDNMNRLTDIWYPNEGAAGKRVTYNDNQSPKAVTDSVYVDFDGEVNRWIVSKSFYDGFGRAIQIKRFGYDGSKTALQNITYNGNGLVDSVCNPYDISGTSYEYSTPTWNNVTTYYYDNYDAITKIKFPTDDSVRANHYACIDTIYDEKGNKTVYKYNAFGQIDTVIDALNNKTSYRYDTLGRLVKVTDATSKETKYYYDQLSRLRGVDGPDASSQWTYSGNNVDVYYEYDDVGNRTVKKDTGTVNYYYDDLYRLTEIRHSADGSTWSDTVRFTYDTTTNSPTGLHNPKGRLCNLVTAGIDSMRFYYDDKGLLGYKRIVLAGMTGQSREKTVAYCYNNAQLCTLVTVSPASKNNYHYNRLGEVNDISNIISSVKYNPAGQMVKRVSPNIFGSVTDTISYDSRLRPTRIKSYKSATNFVDLTYIYEKNSNVDSVIDGVDTNNRQNYTYDALNRLTIDSCPAGNQTFTYDYVGNRLSKNGTDYSYYSNSNKLQQDHRGYKFYYNNFGNIIRRRQGSPETTVDSFAYDWNQRLIYYKKISTGAYCEFAYNASGLRVKKHYNDPGSGVDDTVYYVYSGIDPIAEYSSGGSLLVRYVYANGRHIARIEGADTSWYHGDALGSTRNMTSEGGSSVWVGTYYPFGEATTSHGNTHQFTGKEFDSETDLNYFCQRYYDPQVGRFMTLDPLGGYIEMPQSQNRYAYCINNPLKYLDPLGLSGDPNSYASFYTYLCSNNPNGYYLIPGVEATAHRIYPDEPVNPYEQDSHGLSFFEWANSVSSSTNGSGETGKPIAHLDGVVANGHYYAPIIIYGLGYNTGKRTGFKPPKGVTEGTGPGSLGELAQMNMAYNEFIAEKYPIHGSTIVPRCLILWWAGDKNMWACADWATELSYLFESLHLRHWQTGTVKLLFGAHMVVGADSPGFPTQYYDPWLGSAIYYFFKPPY